MLFSYFYFCKQKYISRHFSLGGNYPQIISNSIVIIILTIRVIIISNDYNKRLELGAHLAAPRVEPTLDLLQGQVDLTSQLHVDALVPRHRVRIMVRPVREELLAAVVHGASGYSAEGGAVDGRCSGWGARNQRRPDSGDSNLHRKRLHLAST